VPVTTLHLPKEYAYDSLTGEQIRYSVYRPATALNALNSISTLTVTGDTLQFPLTPNLVTNISSTSGLSPGMFLVRGNGIPKPDTITQINSPASLTLATAPSIAHTGISLTFSIKPLPDSTILPSDTINGFTIRGPSIGGQPGAPITHEAVYALVAYGFSGHGAFPHSGGKFPVNAGMQNVDILTNCDCDSSAVLSCNAPAGVFVQSQSYQPTDHPGDRTYFFDHMVVYGTPENLLGPNN